MYAVIYGTGKWAQLLGKKLNQKGIVPIFLGSDKTIAPFQKEYVNPSICNLPVFICSQTQNHYQDLLYALKLNPQIIFIEKGFSNDNEFNLAREKAVEVPVYFLSQYRFSLVLETFIESCSTIKSIFYDWQVDQHHAQEWMYHIISIDNYIKNAKSRLFVNDYGSWMLDSISKISISKSIERSCTILIRTDQGDYRIILGKQTSILKNNYNLLSINNEDCLDKQITEIVNQNFTRLERL